jgi:orotidine-5'-phosphate decarboxylase
LTAAQVIVVLDFASAGEALDMVDSLGEEGEMYKVGLELFSREGPAVVEALTGRGKRVFLDLKLHDIPNTVAGAVASVRDLGIDFLTIHTTGGLAMMSAAAEAAGDAVTLLGVTILTSMSTADLGRTWNRRLESVSEEVVRLAQMAVEAGVRGVVASALEARTLRSTLGSEPVIVTPGIRLAGDATHDQARVCTPADAAEAGADFLVVGRSITASSDPLDALRRVLAELGGSPNVSNT